MPPRALREPSDPIPSQGMVLEMKGQNLWFSNLTVHTDLKGSGQNADADSAGPGGGLDLGLSNKVQGMLMSPVHTAHLE